MMKNRLYCQRETKRILVEWKEKAKALIKTEMAKHNMNYAELLRRLSEMGIEDTQANLSNKINRGTFSFIFALQVFKAIGVERINLADIA